MVYCRFRLIRKASSFFFIRMTSSRSNLFNQFQLLLSHNQRANKEYLNNIINYHKYPIFNYNTLHFTSFFWSFSSFFHPSHQYNTPTIQLFDGDSTFSMDTTCFNRFFFCLRWEITSSRPFLRLLLLLDGGEGDWSACVYFKWNRRPFTTLCCCFLFNYYFCGRWRLAAFFTICFQLETRGCFCCSLQALRHIDFGCRGRIRTPHRERDHDAQGDQCDSQCIHNHALLHPLRVRVTANGENSR